MKDEWDERGERLFKRALFSDAVSFFAPDLIWFEWRSDAPEPVSIFRRTYNPRCPVPFSEFLKIMWVEKTVGECLADNIVLYDELKDGSTIEFKRDIRYPIRKN